MARGQSKSNDGREVFHIDRLRFIDRAVDPQVAPEKNTCEIYFKGGNLFRICDDGVSAPVNGLGVSASPGFTWGRKGKVSSVNKPYLLNDEVPSNVTGRLVTFSGPIIRRVLITNSATNTFTATIQEHDGTTFTDLLAVIVSAARSTEADVSVPVTSGKELAVRITSGSADDPVVGVILDGLF